MAYKSKFAGAEIDSRLQKVVEATGATASAAGKTGLIPASPTGGMKKVLFGDMTWGDLYTEISYEILHLTAESTSDEISQVVGGVSGFNVLYNDIKAGKIVAITVSDDQGEGFLQTYNASTQGSSSGEKIIAFYSDEVMYVINLTSENTFSFQKQENIPDVKTINLDIFGNNGTLSDYDYQNIVDAYNSKSVVGLYNGSRVPVVIGNNDGNYSINMATIIPMSGYYSILSFNVVVSTDKTYTKSETSFILYANYFKYLDFMVSTPVTVTTLANLPNKHNIIANISAATNLSVVSGMMSGTELQIRVFNTTASDIVQPLPNTGKYESMHGTSVTIPANSFIELNIWFINGIYVIRVGENS